MYACVYQHVLYMQLETLCYCNCLVQMSHTDSFRTNNTGEFFSSGIRTTRWSITTAAYSNIVKIIILWRFVQCSVQKFDQSQHKWKYFEILQNFQPLKNHYTLAWVYPDRQVLLCWYHEQLVTTWFRANCTILNNYINFIGDSYTVYIGL